MPFRWQEPFGIVGIEALKFGARVIAWDSGGIKEWHRGPLPDWGDIAAMSELLKDSF